MNPLTTYLRQLRDIRASGANVPETSFYAPLANLLNAVGRTLKPRVRCIINPKNQGAGIPDGDFFTADQLPRTGEPDLHAQLPARGVMEVKGPSDDVWQTARSAQMAKYLGAYGQVLVTNYGEALGVTFEGRRGDHFFRSMLVQTLFYGIFSAWVLWSKKRAPGNIAATFDWRITPWELHVPLIRGLFEQMAMPSKLGPLALVEVLDRTGAALNRVEPEAFFARFEESQAVQYFYEPFLEAFDPELRKELGVWYTPPEIVQYMVTRVDTVLHEELGIKVRG